MPSFDGIFSALAGIIGLLCGIVFAVIFAGLGYWLGLLAIPLTPFVLVVLVKAAFGSNA